MTITRRRFGSICGGTLIASGFGGGCDLQSLPLAGGDGRLSARPAAGAKTTAAGTRPLELERNRDAVLQMPGAVPATPLPLLLMLHGAGGSGQGVLRRVAAAAEDAGVAVLAPDSRDGTWDAIRGSFGRDVAFIDRALAKVFEIVSVDPQRIAVGGFSDGASYALSLGLVNGDLFRTIVAFSPGFIVDGVDAGGRGRPEVFISHGTSDQILPIDQCSRRIVPQLRRSGYTVTFREFEGRHELPLDIARAGLEAVSRKPSG